MTEDCGKVAELIHHIHRRKISDTHRAVLVAMAVDADPITGHMKMRIERLAWLLDKSESQARRDLQSTVAAGLLTTIKASKGRFPSVYSFNAEAAQPKPLTGGHERVDYTQPTKNTADSDRVSDSQPTVVEPKYDRVQMDETTLSSHQNQASNGRVDRVAPAPPNNPPGNTKDSNTNTALSANALVDMSPQAAEILALFKIKPPDIAEVERALAEYPFENIRTAVFKAVNNPKVHDPWAYAKPAFKDAPKTPPSVPPVSPSTNGTQKSAFQLEQEANMKRWAEKDRRDGKARPA